MFDAMLYENDGESSKLLKFLLFCNISGKPLSEMKEDESCLKSEPETEVESSKAMLDNGNPNIDASATTVILEATVYDATHPTSKGIFPGLLKL